MELKEAIPLIAAVATASGYLAIHAGLYSRFRSSTLEWEQRLFESGLVGALLFAVSRGLAVLELHFRPETPDTPVYQYFKHALPFPFSASLFVTVMLGLILGRLQNLVIPPSRALSRAVRRFGTARQIALLDALLEIRTILIELKTGRIVVGWVEELPPFDRKTQIVTVIPLSLGSRDSNGRIALDRFLGDRYQTEAASAALKSALDKYRMTVDLEEIETTLPFEPKVVEEFQRSNRETP